MQSPLLKKNRLCIRKTTFLSQKDIAYLSILLSQDSDSVKGRRCYFNLTIYYQELISFFFLNLYCLLNACPYMLIPVFNVAKNTEPGIIKKMPIPFFFILAIWRCILESVYSRLFYLWNKHNHKQQKWQK